MLSFVSQPLGPIYIRMSRVAGDAFNTAASDDTDPMRQTDGRTARRGGTLQKAEANCMWTPPLSRSPRGCPLQYSGLSLLCQIQRKNTLMLTQHFSRFYMYLQPIDRFTCVLPYMPIWICRVCLFRSVCMHSYMHACACVYVC